MGPVTQKLGEKWRTPITLRRDHGRNRPGDRQRRIVVTEGAFLVRDVVLRMQITDNGNLGERLITVRDSRRQVQLVMVEPIKVDAKLPKVRRRVRPDVDDDVFDRPVLAAYDLRLTATDPHVHAPHDAEQRLRRVVLRPMRG